MHRTLQTLLMALILPTLAFLAIVVYELFSKEPNDDLSYPTRFSDHSRKPKLPGRRKH